MLDAEKHLDGTRSGCSPIRDGVEQYVRSIAPRRGARCSAPRAFGGCSTTSLIGFYVHVDVFAFDELLPEIARICYAGDLPLHEAFSARTRPRPRASRGGAGGIGNARVAYRKSSAPMTNSAPVDRFVDVLSTLLREEGTAILDDAFLLRGLLKDELGGELGTQVDLLIAPLKHGIVAQMRSAPVRSAELHVWETALAQEIRPESARWVLEVLSARCTSASRSSSSRQPAAVPGGATPCWPPRPSARSR